MVYVPCVCQNWNGPVVCCCRYCGLIFTSTRIIRCPVCDCCNVINYPIRESRWEHKQLTFKWLESHGFDFVKFRLEVDMFVE